MAHHWPQARRGGSRYAYTELLSPTNLSKTHAWSWHDPRGQYRNILFGGPLIDAESAIYVAMRDGIRKFTPTGKLLWHYTPPTSVSTCPSLYGEALYGNTDLGHLFSISLSTGKALWVARPAASSGSDCSYIQVSKGIVVAGFDIANPIMGGNLRVLGINSTSGAVMWRYDVSAATGGTAVYNLYTMFMNDSAVFMDCAGGMHRVLLADGKQVWYTPPPKAYNRSFTDGGSTLSPDATMVYSCSNLFDGYSGGGAVRAYRLHDGSLIWDHKLQLPCNSFPAIGGNSVIVPTGPFSGLPMTLYAGVGTTQTAGPNDRAKAQLWKQRRRIHRRSLRLGSAERSVLGHPLIPASIVSLDAASGDKQWELPIKPYGRESAIGDEEGVLIRLKYDRRRPVCAPPQWSAPVISGDGVVHIGRADGHLYAISPPSSTNSLPNVRKFDAGSAFLHPGTAWAPGLMAVTTCDTLHVFRDPEIAIRRHRTKETLVY